MDKKRFQELRSDVLDKFNNIESLMNLLISAYYFKSANQDFIFRVLNNAFFPSSLRIDISLKMVKDPNKKRSSITNDLKEMSNIRNYFAHITPQYFDVGEDIAMEKVGWFPDPKDPSKKIDLVEKYDQFIKLEKEVNPYLINECRVLGINFPVNF